MEMCYYGALVMPKNYAVVTEEEMTYVDGGGILIAGLVLCYGSTAAAAIAGAVVKKISSGI